MTTGADKAAMLARKAAAGRGLPRGEWAVMTGKFHNLQRFEIELREYLNGLGESLMTQWGDPEGDRFEILYRVGKKRGPAKQT